MIDRRAMRFLSAKARAWNHVAMDQAILPIPAWSRQSVIKRSMSAPASSWAPAVPSARTIVEAADITLQNKGPKRVGPFAVPKAMSSTASATLATWFKIKGVNYSISSACCDVQRTASATPTETIQYGKQDIIFAGGHARILDWSHLGAVRCDGRDVVEVQRQRRPPRRVPTMSAATVS